MAADALASVPEERDEQRELIAGYERRRQHDDHRDDRPAGDVGAKPRRLQRQQDERERRRAIAERVRRRDGGGLEQRRDGESDLRRAAIAGDERIQESARADAGERDGQHETEREDRSAEQRSEQAVPNQLEQEEREADRGGGDEREYRKAGRVGQVRRVGQVGRVALNGHLRLRRPRAIDLPRRNGDQ